MDSGNSGSLQSSSGGDEEYDSRATAAAADSIFINTHQPPHRLFDPFSNYTQQLHRQNPHNFNNPNGAWPDPTSIRYDPNPNIANPFMSSLRPSPPPAGGDNSNNNPGGGSATSASERNTRKRSRASRRAPTTVLNTDTTNFRAMVQEFTGVPAPPFSNPSFPRSNRLDNLVGLRSAVFDAAEPPHLRRPFAQRCQTPAPFLVSSSTNSNITSSSSTTPMINYQQLPIPHIQTSNDLLSNINNNQNRNPFFSSLLQTNPSKFIFSDSSATASKPINQGSFEIPSDDIKNGPGLNEFGLGIHGNHATATLNDLPGVISSDQVSQPAARNNRENNTVNENIAKWRRNNNNNNNDRVGKDDNGDDYSQAQLKPVNGGYDLKGSTSSNFHGEKNPENVATREEQGMVDSWIYSSEQK